MHCVRCGASFQEPTPICPSCRWNADAMHSELAGYRPGELVRDRYEIHEPLDVGRFGATVSAFDIETELKVTLKIIHPALLPTPEHGRLFLTGVRALGRKTVPGLARIHGANCEGDRYFVVLEPLDGATLMRLIDDRRSHGSVFDLEETLRVLEQIAGILDASPDICHGALTPTKIWPNPDGMIIADVGMLNLLPVEACVHLMKKARRFRGYIAPELRTGDKADSRTDVYCATALLGEMTTLISFDGRKDIFKQNAPDLCGSFDSVLQRGLSEDPKDRFATVGELVDALYYLSGLTRRKNDRADDELEKDAEAQIEDAFRELGLSDEEDHSAKFESEPTQVREPPASHVSKNKDDISAGTAAPLSMEDVIRAHIENSSFDDADDGQGSVSTASTQIVLNPKDLEEIDDRQGSIIPSWDDLGNKTEAKKDAPESIEEAAREATGRFDVSELRRQERARSSSKNEPCLPVEPPKPRPRAAERPTPPPPALSSPEGKPVLPRPNVKVPAPGARRAPVPQRAGTYMLTPKKPGGLATPPRKQARQLERREFNSGVEVTQELDLEDLTPIDSGVIPKPRLKSAEEQTTDDLIRRAERLEGIDPRLIRAAHALEINRRTPPHGGAPHSSSEHQRTPKKAEDIDPRFLKAAAQLDAQRESAALPDAASSFHATKRSTALADIDPRLLRAAARLEFQKKRVPEDRVVISSDDVTQTESGIRRRNAEFVSFLVSEDQPLTSRPRADKRRDAPASPKPQRSDEDDELP